MENKIIYCFSSKEYGRIIKEPSGNSPHYAVNLHGKEYYLLNRIDFRIIPDVLLELNILFKRDEDLEEDLSSLRQEIDTLKYENMCQGQHIRDLEEKIEELLEDLEDYYTWKDDCRVFGE